MDNIILALDQSTQVTGLAIYVNGQLESWEHISPDGEMFERIIKLKAKLKNKITELMFRGKLFVAIEERFFSVRNWMEAISFLQN